MGIRVIFEHSVVVGSLMLPACAFGVEMRVAAELMHFDYEETDQLGQTINQETGYIPGLTLAASRPYRSIKNSVEFSVYDGQVDYDGRTMQTGQPHQTTTKQTIVRLQYRLDWSPDNTEGGLYGKAYWQQWDRDIQPNNGVLGLFERYRWWTFEAGMQVPFFQQERSTLVLELGALATSHGTIMIDLTEVGFGNHTLDLGDGFGFSGQFKYEFVHSDTSSLQLGVQLKRWEFGRSNSETLPGTNNSITEPDSTTVQTIFSASYIHRF